MIDKVEANSTIDSVLAEIRRIKEEISSEHDHNVARILTVLRREQEAHRARIVSRLTTRAGDSCDDFRHG